MKVATGLAVALLALAACGDRNDNASNGPALQQPDRARFGKDPAPPPAGAPRTAADTPAAGASAVGGDPAPLPAFDANPRAALAQAQNLTAAMPSPAGAANAAPAGGIKAVFVGDSHSAGPFGQTLDAGLRKHGWDLSTYAVCGASLGWWQSDSRHRLSCGYFVHASGQAPVIGEKAGQAAPPLPTIEQILTQGAPNVFIIALGANSDGSDSSMAANGAKLLKRLPPQSRCVWIGPPPMQDPQYRIDAFYETVFPQILKDGGRDCTLIDSRGLVDAGKARQSHYDNAEGAAWGGKAEAKVLALFGS